MVYGMSAAKYMCSRSQEWTRERHDPSETEIGPPWPQDQYCTLFAIRATKDDSMTKRFWSCALMTLLSAGVSSGFSLAGLLGPSSDDSFARYAASRSIALLLTVLVAIRVRSRIAIA